MAPNSHAQTIRPKAHLPGPLFSDAERTFKCARQQQDSPVAGHVQAKTGSRAGITPADQTLIGGLNLVGYAKAKSGRQLVFAIMLRDVPVSLPQDSAVVDADLGAIAAAIQQGD